MADIAVLRADLPGPLAEAELERQDPKELARLKAAYTKVMDLMYPKPTIGDINGFHQASYSVQLPWRQKVKDERERRYGIRKMEPKIRKTLKFTSTIQTRLTHNELLRVVSAQTSNPPIVHVPPSGDSPDDIKASEKEERWCNQIGNYVERSRALPTRRRFVDAQNEDGFALYEWYLTKDYDDLDTKPRQILDHQHRTYRDETPREVNKRLEKSLIGRRPFGIRYVDGLNGYIEEDEDGVCRALIVERKPWRQVMEAAMKRGRSPDEMAKLREPDRSDGLAWPDDFNEGAGPGIPTCQTIRYYDRRWTAYIVDGQWAEEPEEHGLPGCPVFPGYGMVTSSPNPDQKMQGICMGMGSIENAIDDLMTLAMDTMFRYSRPKLVIETPPEGSTTNDTHGKPLVLDLDGTDGVRQLGPGQKIANVLEGFQPFLQMPVITALMNLWGKNARNPVSQGESPGASPAGYTISALQVASEEMYGDILRNEQVTWGRVVDFTRQAIKMTIRETVYLAVQSGYGAHAAVKWLGLGPDDISDVPCLVFIDPDTPASKQAKQQGLMAANEKGLLPRRLVQTMGWGADDPDAWDNEIVADEGKKSMAQWAIQDAQQRANMIRQSQQAPVPTSGLVGPGGMPIQSGQAAGGVPAPPQPPTVGGAMAAASQVPGGPGGPSAGQQFAGYAQGGQPGGYSPGSAAPTVPQQ